MKEKISFTVIRSGIDKFFKTTDGITTLLVDQLLAPWFEGYRNLSDVKVVRDGQIIDSGNIRFLSRINPGHLFCGLSKIKPDHMCSEIRAENLEEGDIVEIENINRPGFSFYKNTRALIDVAYAFAFDAATDGINNVGIRIDDKLKKLAVYESI